MDPVSRQIIKQNERMIKNLDIKRLEPFLSHYKIFTNSMLKDICNPNSNYDLFSELPTRGPKAFNTFLKVLEKAGLVKEADSLKNPPKYAISERKYVFYPMNARNLGHCLIINNINFIKQEERYGSDVDARQLQNLFERIGYCVQSEKNLDGEDMKSCLTNFSKQEYLNSSSCCLIIILSHGGNVDGEDFVMGSDESRVKKKDIYEIFNNINCKHMRMKPKVFLFQACRGKNDDEGVYSTDSTDTVKKGKIPSLSDMLIVHSSLPDHKAYRDHILGSWLIQDLVSVFTEKYLQEDLEAMLKSVNRKIQVRLSLRGEKKQVPHIEHFGWRADLHICSSDDFKGCEMNLRSYNLSEV